MSLLLAYTIASPYTRRTSILSSYCHRRLLHHLLQQQHHPTTTNHEKTNNKINFNTNNQQRYQIPCFNLERHHFGLFSNDNNNNNTSDGNSSNDHHHLSTPTSFHSYLINAISHSQHRITLASLYIGTGSHLKERQLLTSLREACNRGVTVTILLDENRALRQTRRGNNDETTTCSAAAVRESLDEKGTLFLYNALSDDRLWSRATRRLPNPLNEVAGVFHIKAYVIDDNLLLSGANLSEEYFTDRQDRHLLFTNGANGLVNFYQDLITTFCHHSSQYSSNATIIPPSSSSSSSSSSSIENSLAALYSRHYHHSSSSPSTNNKNVIAHVIPTIQLPPPNNPHRRPSLFPSDAQIIRSLLTNTLHHHHRRRLFLCSAYLNPTPSFLQTLLHCRPPTTNNDTPPSTINLLTAGPTSHGFKKGKRRWISTVFRLIARDLSLLKGVMVYLYEREGWTFHGKGLWIVEEEEEERRLVATVVGSGNYGERSEMLDVESQCVIILAKKSDDDDDDGSSNDDKDGNDDVATRKTKRRRRRMELSEALLKDWDDFQQYARVVDEMTDTTREVTNNENDWWIRLVIPFIKKFF